MTGTRRILGCALVFTAFAVVADAQSSPNPSPPSPVAVSAVDSAALERMTREVSMELRCPVCQGESIQESPAELAMEMKAVVREQLAAGKTPDEVKAYFVGRYGEWILLRPTTTGVNAALYWLPPLVLLVGVGVVVLLARRWRRASRPAIASPSPEQHHG